MRSVLEHDVMEHINAGKGNQKSAIRWGLVSEISIYDKFVLDDFPIAPRFGNRYFPCTKGA